VNAFSVFIVLAEQAGSYLAWLFGRSLRMHPAGFTTLMINVFIH